MPNDHPSKSRVRVGSRVHQRLSGLAGGIAFAFMLAAPALAQSAMPSAASSPSGGAERQYEAWEKMADMLKPLSRTIAPGSATSDPERAAADTNWMLVTIIAQYVANFWDVDPNYPQFTPIINTAFNSGAPVPDYIYQVAVVDGRGIYRMTGTRGTSRWVEFGEMNGFDGERNRGDLLSRFSLDDVKIAPDGSFSVILSAERPKDYSGDWIRLDPETRAILVRHTAYDWKQEIDARLAIDRLDVPARTDRRDPAKIAQRLHNLLKWTETRAAQWPKHIADQRAAGNVNQLKPFDFQGGVGGQLYLEGLFDIDADHALVVETEVPKECRYWSLLITDNQFATVDWMRHQSSLNGYQAKLDGDGKFRAVVAMRDPGVPNWIDTAGLDQGVMQLRWNNCSSQPMPKVTKVALGRLRKVLPADTPKIDEAARRLALQERREGAQLRRKW